MASANETRNEDWLRTSTWDLPTTVEGLRQVGIDPQAVLKLPSAEAMPPELRVEIEALAAAETAQEMPPLQNPDHQTAAARFDTMTATDVALLIEGGDDAAAAWLLAAWELAENGDADARAWFGFDPAKHPKGADGKYVESGPDRKLTEIIERERIRRRAQAAGAQAGAFTERFGMMPAVEVVALADAGDTEASAWLTAALDLLDAGDPDARVWFREFDESEVVRDKGKFAPKAGASASDEVHVSLEDGKTVIKANVPPPSQPKERGETVDKVNKAAMDAKMDTESQHDYVQDQRGQWSAERTAIHHEIVRDAFERQVAGGARQDREAIMLGGLPGSGKTSATKDLIDVAGYITVSPDNMKEEMARRELFDAPVEGMGRMEASPLIHEESSKLAKDLATMAIAGGYNVVWDMTMNSQSSIDSRMDIMNRIGGGYRVTGVFVDVPVDQAVAAAQKRYEGGLAENPEMARYTPEAMIRAQADPTGAHDSVNEATFESFKAQFNDWVKIDNTDWKHEIVGKSSDRVFDLLKNE